MLKREVKTVMRVFIGEGDNIGYSFMIKNEECSEKQVWGLLGALRFLEHELIDYVKNNNDGNIGKKVSDDYVDRTRKLLDE